jgi:hypothetical protein
MIAGGFLGILGGIVGIMGGGLSLYDRWAVADLEVKELVLVAVSRPMRGTDGMSDYIAAAIAVVYNDSNQPAYVGGLYLTGRHYLSLFQLSVPLGFGKSNEELEIELKRKPYFQVSAAGWPREGGGPYRIEPKEERFLSFQLSQTYLGPGVTVYRGSPARHLGFEVGPAKPSRLFHDPPIHFLFRFQQSGPRTAMGNYVPAALGEHLLEGSLKFELRVGSSNISISAQKLESWRWVSSKAWLSSSAEEIYAGEHWPAQ